MLLPNNFNRQIYWSDLPILFMVRCFYRSDLPVLFMFRCFYQSNLLILFMVRKFFAMKKVWLNFLTMNLNW
jgi:hypothetical protein